MSILCNWKKKKITKHIPSPFGLFIRTSLILNLKLLLEFISFRIFSPELGNLLNWWEQRNWDSPWAFKSVFELCYQSKISPNSYMFTLCQQNRTPILEMRLTNVLEIKEPIHSGKWLQPGLCPNTLPACQLLDIQSLKSIRPLEPTLDKQLKEEWVRLLSKVTKIKFSTFQGAD